MSGALHSADRPSDHLPLSVKVSARRDRSARLPRLAAELVRTTAFRACMARLSAGLGRGGDLIERYDAVVEVAHSAARAARSVLFAPDLSEPALLAEAAMWVRGGTHMRARLPQRFREWREFGGMAAAARRTFFGYIALALPVLVRTAEIEKRTLPEHDRRARLSQMRRHHATIRRMRRRQVAASWYSDDGEPLHTPADIGDALGAYWGDVYQETHHDSDDAEDFLRFVQVCDGAEWSWERGRTRELAALVRGSSPGQDRLSYAFWAEAPP